MKNGTPAIFLFLFLSVFSVYSNTFDSSWQLDDKANILGNYGIQMDIISPESIWRASFSKEGHYNYRPIPNLTFGFNWYFGKDNPEGYHFVNILIHFFTACLVFLSCSVILKTPNIKKIFSSNETILISGLASLLWALHPIQTQAVTYIVQRMTSMAAMFSAASVYYYVKGRNLKNQSLSDACNQKSSQIIDCHKKNIRYKNYVYFTLSILCYLSACFSKENAIILPLSAVIIEISFFHDFNSIKNRWKTSVLFILFFLAILICAVFFLKNGNFLFFLDGYKNRTFTIWERLLTEPRIILHYLSQIFYPLHDRFSVAHDIMVSKNLFEPVTTVFSALTVFVIIFFGLLHIQKKPLISFAILFYFLNHITESTFIPLELFFEHRNYLPSMFLFLPLACLSIYMLKLLKGRNNVMFVFAGLVLFSTILFLGINTYKRNSIWKTELSLWYDAFKKAPGDLRSANNLASIIAWRDGATSRDLDTAEIILEKALLLNNVIRKDVYRDVYGNLGNIYFKKKMFEKSLDFHRKSLEIDPGFSKGRFDMVKSLIMLARWDEASMEMDAILNKKNTSPKSDHFNVKGFILLWQDKPDEALYFLRRALHMSPWNPVIFLNIGRALSMACHYRNAEWFLLRLSASQPGNIISFLCLIENSIKAGDIISAEKYTERMLASNGIDSITATIDALPLSYQTVPVSLDIIKPFVTKKIMELTGQNSKNIVDNR